MKIFNKGQVVIPVELRRRYDIKIGDTLDILPEKGAIKLIPNRGERLTANLFGILSRYREVNPELSKELINKVTEESFARKTK